MFAFFITSRVGRAIALAGAVLLALVTFGASERAKGRKQAAIKAKDEYIKTRKDMDDAENHGDDADAAREWLSKRK